MLAFLIFLPQLLALLGLFLGRKLNSSSQIHIVLQAAVSFVDS